ncbi:MAG: L,D-transpeptidase family protein [Flavobacteriales bacterium]|nr:L,D-transpeptidase family protein [Flavobacteriales bacterium]MBK6945770.1 L,D-transpeptidase family protein [Flavobacteriales bacterium]MBK7241869.1 L,D-transpeptidase family protein [Flavobacteriales bacterium]MBK7298807.1 L,D-transpeptidase family protein [Flavobacteriales bacterium]MBK9534680.1 L,D-transpeptidase family protein [Flavobacteriales bacterium]
MIRPYAVAAFLSLTLFACQQPEPKPTLVEVTQEITEVFETPQAYSIRTLAPDNIEVYLTAHPESRIDSAGINDFYARRNFQFAWFANDSLSHSAAGFLSLVTTADGAYKGVDELRNRIQMLISSTQVDGKPTVMCDTCQLDLELSLTAQFFRFADKQYGGTVGKDLRELDWFIPRSKKDYAQLLDSMAAGHMDLSPIEPLHPQYALLKAQLKKYHSLDSLGSWPELSLGERKKIEPLDSAQLVGDIRQRLTLLGDFMYGKDTVSLSDPHYDSTLVRAVQRFQSRHGLHPDGIIGNGFMAAINVPPRDRLRSLLVNMERLRWVPRNYAPNQILVNIPEFRMHIFENGEEAWNMDVVVGNTATRTVIFSDTLSTIVFSPYWGVPKSIVQGEILPAMAKDPNYLKKKGMERIGGSDANPIIRQKPGARNALGLVKFLFPNSYSIYFHDTPSKGGFAREQRAFSHGCIRLSKPKELAEYLLRNDTTWTSQKIDKAMHSGKEQYVVLKDRRPVTIGYFTAWVGVESGLNFRNDIYGQDERLAKEIFIGAPAAPPLPEVVDLP